MTASEPLPLPGVRSHTPAEGGTNPLLATASRCGNPDCGHLAEFHNLATNNLTRKACSVSTGPNATQCKCRLFAELS